MATTAQQNKALARQFLETLHLQPAAVDTWLHPQALVHTPFPGQPAGPRGLKTAVQLLRTAFPDLAVKTEDLLAEHDLVMVRLTLTGTHQGSFMGILASGKGIAFQEMVTLRMVNGQVTEYRSVTDALALLHQVGAAPIENPEETSGSQTI